MAIGQIRPQWRHLWAGRNNKPWPMRSVFDMVAEESSAILLVASAVMLDTCNILPVAQIQQSGHGGMWFFKSKLAITPT